MALLTFGLTNCSYNWGNFNKYALTAPSNLEIVGSCTVSGTSCSFGPYRWYASSIAEAAREALLSVPGETGLKDVEGIVQSYQYLFLGCVKVEGTPVKEIPETKSKKK
ncbi:hypothetical protein HGB47_09805 [Leptospira yasudae]|uniref:hypothetical protein n=1 Tax=Leptospira yasudae TaxID=2202201 RepID=UPI001C4E4F40|nr:hypothetical protein [Leptospira yasudae]MBW0433911.1 hypothetical protein [Leptospira yasudae]